LPEHACGAQTKTTIGNGAPGWIIRRLRLLTLRAGAADAAGVRMRFRASVEPSLLLSLVRMLVG